MPDDKISRTLTMTHWGAYEVASDGARVLSIEPWAADPDPSPIGRNMVAVDAPGRVRRPAVRQGWLEHGPGRADRHGGGRGAEPFVEVDWATALDLVAGELGRVYAAHGPGGIYGGSYGWSSAGRFHHAQSQVHRFLNAAGGYVRSVDNYSHAAANVIVPHVVGHSYDWVQRNSTSLPVIAKHTDLLVTFGGIPLKNAQISHSGIGRHELKGHLAAAVARGMEIVNISPLRDDIAAELGGTWLPVRPNADTAVMLALMHTLVAGELVDRAFLERYCTGYDRLAAYLLGRSDGVAKDADWAAGLSGIDADTIRHLARRLVACRSMVTVSWSLQRADHGEQPYWAVIALAALVGQIGELGGGFGMGYGAVGSVGNGLRGGKPPTLPQLRRPHRDFIPVARIADALLDPGGSYPYDGETRTYPDLRLVYWAGGNPFHHHQDLNRLVAAWQRPETVVVHEPFWTATARHADIVLPSTTPLEREDIGGAATDDTLVAMRQAIAPIGEARDDYAIFAALSERLGTAEVFTEGRDTRQWLRHLYEAARDGANDMPDFDSFWRDGVYVRRDPEPGLSWRVLMGEFRADPRRWKLPTPSGRIELYSETIAGFALDDCPPHPAWLAPREWLGAPEAARFPLHLVSNQPADKLHSQWDHGPECARHKIQGRATVTVNPATAARHGLSPGGVVRVHNDRGACLAGLAVSDAVMPDVAVLPTGAWYDPVEPGGLCAHGNPNVLTYDAGTSGLAQGPSAHSCLVAIEPWSGPLPPVRAHQPPAFIPPSAGGQ